MPKSTSGIGPQFVRYFGPLLEALRGLGGSGTPDEVAERIARDQNIPDELRNELLPSGESRYRNQIHWARFYLAKDGLIDASKRGVWSLSEQGLNTTLSPSQAFELFSKIHQIFQERRRRDVTPNTARIEAVLEQEATPDETPEAISNYRVEMIKLMLDLPPAGFERLTQRILREAGFVEVEVTGRSGDGGIDGHGTLRVNELVSFKVPFQCKRYAGSVTPSQVREFRGAMSGRADRGIMITTGAFTTQSRREASREGVPPIELIDGTRLVDMLEQLELGLRPVTTFEIDDAFFNEFRGA